MPGKIISYFHHRTKEDIFFGSLSNYPENQLFEIVKLYFHDVIKFLFNEIPNNQRVFVPIKDLSTIQKEFTLSEIKYYFAGKYVIFESINNNLKNEVIDQIKTLFSSSFPLSHLKYSTPSVKHSQEYFKLTQNCIRLHDILPFPNYIIWAFSNQEKSCFKINDWELDHWGEQKISRLINIKIVTVNQDILTFKIETESTIAIQIPELLS